MYVTATGRKFVLINHGPTEWADHVYAAFIDLGCSPEYAEKAADEIRSAKLAGA